MTHPRYLNLWRWEWHLGRVKGTWPGGWSWQFGVSLYGDEGRICLGRAWLGWECIPKHARRRHFLSYWQGKPLNPTQRSSSTQGED